ncbi:MAG: CFI-box-CTERM domain-containing protein [Myxococcota bacterium]
MQPEELIESAKARAEALAPPSDVERERLRGECVAFFDQVPEPPVYRRANDPSRALALALTQRGEELLARCMSASREDGGSGLARLVPVLKAYLAALCHTAEGRLGSAENAWREGLLLEREAVRGRSLCVHSTAEPVPVFDKATRTSRYDPRPEPTVTVRLACPAAGCAKEAAFALPGRLALHALTCPSCQSPFLAYVGEVRAAEKSSPVQGVVSYRLRIEEPDGTVSRVEIDDTSGAELSVARKDQVACLYTAHRQLRGLLNLSSGRVLWVNRSGACFVATVAFGEDAQELVAFRAFRDRVLLRHTAGAAAVRLYYRHGPAWARFVARRPWLLAATRYGLRRLHHHLERRG